MHEVLADSRLHIMEDIQARLKPLFRRTSTLSSAKSSVSSNSSIFDDNRGRSKTSLLFPISRKSSASEPVPEDRERSTVDVPTAIAAADTQPAVENLNISNAHPRLTADRKSNLVLTLEEPIPDTLGQPANVEECHSKGNTQHLAETDLGAVSPRPDITRRQSLAHSSQNRFLKSLLQSDRSQPRSPNGDYFGGPPTISANMLHRKIWVKRPGASATLVSINEDDLVDDVRDMILKKYVNSLGRSFDAPDVTLKVVPRNPHRHSQGERILGPEEPISRTLDAYFPGGQTVDEALIIDVPQRRTPRHSPRVPIPYYLADEVRPGESGTDYFPPMPVAGQHSPHLPHLPPNLAVNNNGVSGSHHQPLHSITVINTGQVPPLPSPVIRSGRHPHSAHRPKHGRTITSSPTAITGTLNGRDRRMFYRIHS